MPVRVLSPALLVFLPAPWADPFLPRLRAGLPLMSLPDVSVPLLRPVVDQIWVSIRFGPRPVDKYSFFTSA